MEYARIIVTGASSGLGAAYAEALVRDGAELVLVARRRERLEALAERLRKQCAGAQVRVRVCDLANPAERAEMAAELAALPPVPSLLINNAGLGDYGDFAQAELRKIHNLLQVNISALVELTHALLPSLTAAGNSAVLNTASLAADLFIPDFALYAASKAFVASFSEALHIELKRCGVRVMAVCPGPVHTEFGEVARRAGYDKGDIPLKDNLYTPIDTVVRGSLKALAAGRSRYYPGAKIWLAGCLLRLLPLWLMRCIMSSRPRRVALQKGGAV